MRVTAEEEQRRGEHEAADRDPGDQEERRQAPRVVLRERGGVGHGQAPALGAGRGAERGAQRGRGVRACAAGDQQPRPGAWDVHPVDALAGERVPGGGLAGVAVQREAVRQRLVEPALQRPDRRRRPHHRDLDPIGPRIAQRAREQRDEREADRHPGQQRGQQPPGVDAMRDVGRHGGPRRDRRGHQRRRTLQR
jgi:hypothetical protein